MDPNHTISLSQINTHLFGLCEEVAENMQTPHKSRFKQIAFVLRDNGANSPSVQVGTQHV